MNSAAFHKEEPKLCSKVETLVEYSSFVYTPKFVNSWVQINASVHAGTMGSDSKATTVLVELYAAAAEGEERKIGVSHYVESSHANVCFLDNVEWHEGRPLALKLKFQKRPAVVRKMLLCTALVCL
jgi:hypothetical protein